MRRRFAYPLILALTSVFAFSGVVSAATPAAAEPPGPGATSRSAAAPKGDLSPREANVPAGTEPRSTAPRSGAAVTTAADGCGGVAALGKIYSCASLSGDRQDVFTVTTTVDDDILLGTLTQTSNNDETDSAGASVYDADGNYLCYYASYPGSCRLGAAGTYTVAVTLAYSTGDVAYTLSLQSVKAPSSCRTLGNAFFSFASEGRAGDLPLGSAGDCYTFDQPVGSVLQLFGTQSTGSVQGEILDGDFQPLCPVGYATECTLTTAGPYHLTMYEFYGNAATYTLRMARISQSVGCPVLRPQAFGDPGDAAGTGNLPAGGGIACHKLRAPAAGGVAIRLDNDQDISWTVYDNAGQRVCDKYDSAWSCKLPAAGDYTLLTGNQGGEPDTYEIAVVALYRSAGCSTGTSLAWNQDAALLHQTSALQTNCQQFRGTAGQRVVAYAAPTSYNELYPLLVDSTGQPLCREYTEETGCALPADGTYRVVTYLQTWEPDDADETYKVQLRSLSSPKGCPVVQPGAYNAAPAGASGPVRCRTLRITEPGRYQAQAFDADNDRTFASVYDVTGHRVCNDSAYCDIPAAGDYTMVLAGQNTGTVIDNNFAYVTSLLPWQPAGCPTLTQELYQGTFTDPGQYLCVQLRETTGARLVELVPSGAGYPPTYVIDSAGTRVCDSSYELWQTSCLLTGTGPYFAVIRQREGTPPAAVTARFVRVDGPPACPAWDGAVVTTGGDDFSVCRSISADGHSTRGTFTWKRVSGTGGAYLSVFDANGIRRCGPTGTFEERTVTCTLPDGPLTVILHAASTDATYELTHQPVATS